jgi:hypothetical protein
MLLKEIALYREGDDKDKLWIPMDVEIYLSKEDIGECVPIAGSTLIHERRCWPMLRYYPSNMLKFGMNIMPSFTSEVSTWMTYSVPQRVKYARIWTTTEDVKIREHIGLSGREVWRLNLDMCYKRIATELEQFIPPLCVVRILAYLVTDKEDANNVSAYAYARGVPPPSWKHISLLVYDKTCSQSIVSFLRFSFT